MADQVGPLGPPLTPIISARDAPITPGKRVAVVDRQKVDPQLMRAAEGMEAMFLDYMMKVMRDSIPHEGGGADAAAHQIYGGMRDSEFAKMAAARGGIGLAEQIIAYLDTQRYTQIKGPAAVSGRREDAPADRTGGVHEGQSQPVAIGSKPRN